jgi:hypothetical protein
MLLRVLFHEEANFQHMLYIPRSATRGDFCRFLFSPCVVANTRRSRATSAFCALQAKKINLSKFHL